MTNKPRVVIVGAGFGGLNAAQSVAKGLVQVTVIDRKNFHTFQPLLYQVATAGLSPGEIAAPIRSILRSHGLRRNALRKNDCSTREFHLLAIFGALKG